MKITYLPHAREQMAERGITEDDVRTVLDVLEGPTLGLVYHRGSVHGRRVAEYLPPGQRLAIKVVYNFGSMAANEYIVITVMRGRPTSRPEGEQR